MMKKMSSPCPSLPSPVNDTEVQPESSTAMPNPAKPVAKRSRKQKRVVHSSDSPGHGQAKRSSVFRGVTSVKRGRYEAHYWDKSASKKNRQIYLGKHFFEPGKKDIIFSLFKIYSSEFGTEHSDICF
ncbi:unnamed protein product [Cuscuta epithymum]|uniref:AP2/ERF domain-containing protein n=1 Tax=Cuscuta epithymum TaxID=186058 RepID=A0AAV0EN16_9ASTE|nr:unnamed protein product [Cuscuta epithymum]